MSNKIRIIGLFALILISFASFSSAATGIENITLSRYSATLMPGGNIIINYSLKLTSGYYAYGTQLYIVNSSQLSSHNVSVLISKNFGNPPINGTMYIFLSHANISGLWNITLAGNSSGVTINPATFTLSEEAPNTSSVSTSLTTSSSLTTTVPQSTAASTVLSTVPPTILTTISYNSSQTNSAYEVIILALIVVIILLILFIIKSKSKRKK